MKTIEIDELQNIKKVQLSYAEYGEMLELLVYKIQSLGIEYSCIHGLPRGGLPIAVHLSHHLQLPLMMNVAQFTTDFPNGRLLVVDDIIDTGRTFERFLEIATLKKIKYDTAVLFYKPFSSITPTVYVNDTTDWICFPWEPFEEKPNREMYQFLGGEIETVDSNLESE